MSWVKVVVRMGIVLAVSVSALAVGVARMVPQVQPSPVRLRRPSPSDFIGVNTYAIQSNEASRFLDPRTGEMIAINLSTTDSLLFGKTSPWEDDNGEREVIGRWTSRKPSAWAGTAQEVGLARFMFPSGKLLDHMALEIVPSGNPCWYADSNSRVLYSGTDGQLYQIEFPDRSAGNQDAELPRPEAITWACRKPGRGDVRVGDPVWPNIPGLDGRLIVSLCYVDEVEGQEMFVPEEIWWLKLSRDGKSIEAAGRLSSPRPEWAPLVQERLPSLALTPDKEVVMAYLTRTTGQATWDLKLAPVAFHSETGEPRARTRIAVMLAENVAVTFPAFSPDGLWVHSIRLPVRSVARADRFSVADAIPSQSGQRLAWHARRQVPVGPLRAIRSDQSRKAPRRA